MKYTLKAFDSESLQSDIGADEVSEFLADMEKHSKKLVATSSLVREI